MSEQNEGTVSHEVIMALNMKENSTIGCAYFNTLDSILYLSEDIPMANTDLAEQFLIHAQPTTVLISARAPELFREFLDKHANARQPGISPYLPSTFIGLLMTTDELCGSFILRGLQSSEFSAESAKERLVNLQLDSSMPATASFSAGVVGYEDDASRKESLAFKSMRCGGSIDLSSEVSVR